MKKTLDEKVRCAVLEKPYKVLKKLTPPVSKEKCKCKCHKTAPESYSCVKCWAWHETKAHNSFSDQEKYEEIVAMGKRADKMAKDFMKKQGGIEGY